MTVDTDAYLLTKKICVEAVLKNSDDVLALVMVTNALRQATKFATIDLTLLLYYFPYARQDRVCNEGEAHGVQAMAGLINSLNYNRVFVLDPHSDVIAAAVNNCVVVPQHELAKEVVGEVIHEKKLALVAPDAGAEKKTNQLAKYLGSWGLTPPVVYATKVRNLANGQILATTYTGDVAGKDLLIVDDICDGGRTFIELAKKLKEGGAKTVSLYVTHGIFSAGLEPLKEHLDHVYCYHSFKNFDDAFVTVKENTHA